MLKVEWAYALGGTRISILLLALLVWLWNLFGRKTYSATLPLSYRVQIIILSFLLVIMSATYVFRFWWLVFRPTKFTEYLTAPSQPFPIVITVILLLLSVIAAHWELILGFGLIQQKRGARSGALVAAPFLIIANVLDAIQFCAKGPFREMWVPMTITILLVVAQFCWLYRFCRSKQAKELMQNVI